MKRSLKITLLVAASVLPMASAQAAGCLIGVSMKTLDAPYFAAQEVAAKERAQAVGCKVIAVDARNDLNKQVADIEDMVAKGINALVVNPHDSQGVVPAIDAATAAGVKVIVIDSTIDPKAHFVTLVQASNAQNGMLVGNWIAKQTAGKHLKIALLSGDQGNEVGQERRLGVISGLVEGQLNKNGMAGFEIVGQGWGKWDQEGGLKVMEDILTAHPDVNVVLGENDSMALGAYKALEAAGKVTDVLLVAASDGQKEALEMIKASKYGATGRNDPAEVARIGVDLAKQAIDGTLPATTPKITNTKPTVITKENVDQFYRPDSVF